MRCLLQSIHHVLVNNCWKIPTSESNKQGRKEGDDAMVEVEEKYVGRITIQSLSSIRNSYEQKSQSSSTITYK